MLNVSLARDSASSEMSMSRSTPDGAGPKGSHQPGAFASFAHPRIRSRSASDAS